jgi:hypothetical protein
MTGVPYVPATPLLLVYGMVGLTPEQTALGALLISGAYTIIA